MVLSKGMANKHTQIVELYNSGLSITQIAKTSIASRPIISKILKSNGIVISKGNRQKLNLPVDEINQLYNNGKSTYQLAKIFNCSDETIRKLIKNIRLFSEIDFHHGDDIKAKIAESCRRKWKDINYIIKVKASKTKEYRKLISEASKKNYAKTLGRWIHTQEAKNVASSRSKALWETDSYREKQKPHYAWRAHKATEVSVAVLKEDKNKRDKWIDSIRKTNAARTKSNPSISMQQRQLYYLLASNKIDFIKEGDGTAISDFYVVDCIIKKQHEMVKPLIVEVQGEYWHSLPKAQIKDRQKQTYIKRHTNYDLLYLNEIDFKSFGCIKSKLNGYGINIDDIFVKVDDLCIKRILEKDAQLFYETFHYSSTIRKGATTFGAFAGDVLVAAASYTAPIRIQAASAIGAQLSEVMELSRLAASSTIRCYNLLSWFISKTIKLLPDRIKVIISYSDQAYGHTGGVYKASNFVKHGDTAYSYHYEDQDHNIYHKKTVWDKSKRFKISETEYALKHDMIKIVDPPKSKWIFKCRQR